MLRPIYFLLPALPFLNALTASAHLTYPAARDFGVFSSAAPNSITITGQTTKNFGWADGTDTDFAKQDDQRYFKFTLGSTTTFTVSVTALDPLTLLPTMFPAFSIYSGLGHGATDSANPDYDAASVTQQYLTSLGAPAKKGAFDALHTWKIGNDLGATAADLITLTYMSNAADGTSDNYGLAPGINGDGLADGVISKSFTMPAGAYTLAVGGANYNTQTDAALRGITVTVSTVPEPSSVLLGTLGLLAIGSIRRRNCANPKA